VVIHEASVPYCARRFCNPCRQKRSDSPLAEAFDYFACDPDEADYEERALRSVAFLMHYLSDVGNRPVDGWIVLGLARTLEEIAESEFGRRPRHVVAIRGCD